jgi:hypothetical protein
MKRQFILDDYYFSKGELNITLIIDDGKYTEDFIDENVFEEYVTESGCLEFFEDCWDAYSESHYTKDIIMNYYDWRDDICERDDIENFLNFYYDKEVLPEIIEE